MREFEKKKLYALINLAKEKKNETLGLAHPFVIIAELLQDCELRIDKYGDGIFCKDKTLVTYTFKSDNQDTLNELTDFYYKPRIVDLIQSLLEDNLELNSEDGELTFETKLVYDLEKLEFAPEVTFEDCENTIIKNLELAEHSIYVAMAWLTNHKIMKVLIEKSSSGIPIIVVADNNESNLKFKAKYPNLNFPIFYVTNFGTYFDNPTTMHLKFCIIDNSIVISGTFNWSERANFNKESLSVDKNESSVNSYLSEFKSLLVEHKCYFTFPTVQL